MIEAQKNRFAVLMAPQAVSNGATLTASLDCIGAAYATIVINFGAESSTDGTGPLLSLLGGDSVTGATVTVTANRTTEDLTAAKIVAYHVDLRGQKRYLKLSLTAAATTDDLITVGAVSMLSRLGEAPSSTSEMADVAVIV